MRPTMTSALPRAAAALSALGLALAAIGGPAAARTPETPSTDAAAPAAPAVALAAPSPDLPGLARLSPELAPIAVDSARFRDAAASYGAVAERHAEAQGQRVTVDTATTALAARAAALRSELAAATARIDGLQAHLDDVEAAIADLSVRLYVSGGTTARIDAALTDEQPSINDHDRRAVLGAASMDVLLAERSAYRARIEDARARVDAAAQGIDATAAERARATGGRAAAVRDEVGSGDGVARERVAYEEARALAVIDGVEFPLVALDAYYRAARTVAEEQPECGVRWWAVAGISRVEGRHGTYGGAALDARGDATRRIIGIQLNGTRNTAVVPDSDGGSLDGDPAYDRAVGPMQFIPSTWSMFQADGNEDGVTTPFNLYDATLATARYLCRASAGLDADPGLRAAYLSYNHSIDYVEQVLSYARHYERSVAVPDEPSRPGS